MSSSEIENLSAFDHSFKAIHDEEIPWEDGLDNNLLTLSRERSITLGYLEVNLSNLSKNLLFMNN